MSLFSALVLLPSIPKIQAVIRIRSNQSMNFSVFGETLRLHAFLNERFFFSGLFPESESGDLRQPRSIESVERREEECDLTVVERIASWVNG